MTPEGDPSDDAEVSPFGTGKRELIGEGPDDDEETSPLLLPLAPHTPAGESD